MVKQINLVDCDVTALTEAFEAARTAIIPDLATCSAADLARVFAMAAPRWGPSAKSVKAVSR